MGGKSECPAGSRPQRRRYLLHGAEGHLQLGFSFNRQRLNLRYTAYLRLFLGGLFADDDITEMNADEA